MLYILTGATGHLGINLLDTLVSNNHDIRVLVLPHDNTSMFPNGNIKIYQGNILDKESLKHIFDLSKTPYKPEDVCVIHAAGIVSIATKKDPLLDKVNVEGTKNILEFVKSYHLGHMIYVSSVHAIPEPEHGTIIREIDNFNPDQVKGHYAKSKSLASKFVFEAFKEGYPITIVHPSGIIGPNDYQGGHMGQMIESFLNGQLNSRINGAYDFVDVRDVSNAIYTISKGKHLGCYILSGHLITIKEMFDELQKLSGKKSKAPVFANWFVKLWAPLIEWVYKLRGKKPLFTPYSLYTLQSNATFSHEKATLTFNYQPRDYKTTLCDTAMWLLEKKRITRKRTILNLLKIKKKNYPLG